MLDNVESRITFEVPTNLDFDKLIRDNNYTLFWQNLQHSEPPHGKDSLAESVVQGDRNSSDFNLMSSLKHFAGEQSGRLHWGVLTSDDAGDGVEGPLVDPSYLWIAAVMALLILSGLFCVCSCYMYLKYRRWQKCVSLATCQTLSNLDVEAPPPYDTETLPSYTIASGLPSYEDAVRHLAARQQSRGATSAAGYEPARRPPIHPPSVVKFFDSRPQNWLNVTIFEEIHYNFVGRGTSAANGAATSTATIGANSEQMTLPKPELASDRQCGAKSENADGLFKIQICMVENEKEQTSNR
ncbi:protein commissureless 2 homolog [Toxorhynchites rutilus septentrionalis]|uniref:protein commissureless 2 homolog n=1 Tax=Toxorhynchites rutilus septentrionalis TaxID=329112 RepID=UPI00247915D1|nr:protein commissureless 2 homolog [Toxorhynchites rutilus septentrionalis]